MEKELILGGAFYDENGKYHSGTCLEALERERNEEEEIQNFFLAEDFDRGMVSAYEQGYQNAVKKAWGCLKYTLESWYDMSDILQSHYPNKEEFINEEHQRFNNEMGSRADIRQVK